MNMVSRRKFLQGLGIGAATAAAVGYAAQREADDLKLESHTLRLPRWDADGFRVAILADIHVNLATSVARAQRAAVMAVEAKPDLIVVLGDYVTTSKPWALDHIQFSLAPLRDARCPCLGIMGNHDYFAEDPGKIIDTLKATPVRLLRNELVDVDGVQVGGVDDALVRRHDPAFFSGARSRSVLGLLHEPDYVEDMPDHISLQLSGHSHGGQVCLPFGRPIRMPKGARRYVGGFYPRPSVPLYVSRGVGTIGPDLRLFCPPEVSVLTLRSAT